MTRYARMAAAALCLLGTTLTALAAAAPPRLTVSGFFYPAGSSEQGGYWGWLRQNSNFGNQFHVGIDYKLNHGAPIYALADGVVTHSSMTVRSFGGDRLPGGAVIIRHRTWIPGRFQDFYALYGHLENIPAEGARVIAGQAIATAGHYYSGGKDIPHLHLGLRPDAPDPSNPWRGYVPNVKDPQGWVDPAKYLSANYPSDVPTPQNGRYPGGAITLFMRGADGAVWEFPPSGSWTRHPSVIQGGVAVGPNADGRPEIFVRGTDSAIYTQWWWNGSWSEFAPFGGRLAGDPTVGVNADGRLQIFARGFDGAIYSRWQVEINGRWNNEWQSMGGSVAGDAIVAANEDGRLQIFVRGFNGATYTKWQVERNGAWTRDWQDFGGRVSDKIRLMGNSCVARRSDGLLQLISRGTDGQFYSKRQLVLNGRWETSWGRVSSGTAIASDPIAVINGAGGIEVFAVGSDAAVWTMRQNGTRWTPIERLAGFVNTAPAVAVDAAGGLRLTVRGTDGKMGINRRPSGGSWSGWAVLGDDVSRF